MLSDDQLHEQLNGELEKLYREVVGLRTNQHVFWEVQEMIQNNPNLSKPSTFYGWMGSMYVAAMSSAVRRLVDQRKDSISFVRFLEQLKQCPSCVSREAYKRRAILLNAALSLDYVENDYDNLVGVGMATPDCTRINNDIRELIRQTETLKRFVNEHVAHTARGTGTTLPKFQDLDNAIVLFEKLVRYYLHLFRGVVMSELLPTWQYDWKEIFRYPWIAASEENRDN